MLPIYDDVSARRITSLWGHNTCATCNSVPEECIYCVLFCLFENVAGMRLERKFPSMLEKVNLAALWSRPRVMSCAHNSVHADREIHS